MLPEEIDGPLLMKSNESWRYVFAIIGVFYIILAVVIMIAYPNPSIRDEITFGGKEDRLINQIYQVESDEGLKQIKSQYQ